MSNATRIGIVAALLVVVGVTMALKQKDREAATAAGHPSANPATQPADATPRSTSQPAEATPIPSTTVPKALPLLRDLGAGKCIPCRMMAPILEELKTQYAGRMDVEFIDVWENPGAGEQYGVISIPTQIFYDANGKELYRHRGFFSKEDILGKWKELGVDVEKKPL